MRFDNGYESEGLSNILERVMQHQTSFVLPENMGRQGLLQMATPTKGDRLAAGEWIRNAFDRLGSALAEPALA